MHKQLLEPRIQFSSSRTVLFSLHKIKLQGFFYFFYLAKVFKMGHYWEVWEHEAKWCGNMTDFQELLIKFIKGETF